MTILSLKQVGRFCFIAILLFGFVGCVSTGTETKVTSGQGGPSMDEAQAIAYDGPKARIAVSQFKNKAGGGWYNKGIGEGMADQLTTALFNSNRYIVLERETLSDVLQEQDLGASGRVKSETAAPIGEIEGAELLVVAAITEFEGHASGGSGGGGGGLAGLFSKVAGGMSSAHMAIDLRVIDAKTSRIVAATSVEGKATDFNLSGALGSYVGGGVLSGALGMYKNTPTGQAIRACIQKAVDFIVSKTPQVYYRYGGQSQMSEPSAPPAQSMDSPESVSITVSALNMRGGPGTSHPIVIVLRQGDTLFVLERQGGWIKGQTESGKVGWVSEKYTQKN